MGKPFEKELAQIISTHEWALTQDINDLKANILQNKKYPLFIIGSGGSLSACYYAAELYQKFGIMAKAVTPLELIYAKDTLRNSILLFISASGKNNDILFSYKMAIKEEPIKVYSLCMTSESPLSKLSEKNSNAKYYGFKIPSGKDGFLATNSLVGFFTILYKTLNISETYASKIKINKEFQSTLNSFIKKISPDFTFTTLYAGFAHPIAIDIESKLAEAALGDVLISDYRNFGHGRHHWFAKRKSNSAIIALITPREEDLAAKTLALLPKEIPVLILRSENPTSFSSIELLIKSFYFINELGKKQNIDPGKPGVPGFGRKLYHLNYQRLYEQPKRDPTEVAITRKADFPYEKMVKNEKDFWNSGYKKFIKNITSVEFGTLVFDYDGTICSSTNRYTGIEKAITDLLISFLNLGIVIGIATGRGKSVRDDLQKVIPKKFWNQVIIGYYNCSDIGVLNDNSLPRKDIDALPQIKFLFDKLKNEKFICSINPELKPCQVTIEIENKNDWDKVRLSLIQFILKQNQSNIQILESSHSMDIVEIFHANKLNIIEHCVSLARSKKLSECILCIGDKGRWPGNDYQLLSSLYSLSVDEISSLTESCWNLAPSNVKNIAATIYYLNCLSFHKTGLKFQLR